MFDAPPAASTPLASGSAARRIKISLQALVVVAAVTLLALTWGATVVSTDSARREAQRHAEASVANLALSVEWQFDRQLQAIDQVVRLLAAQWQADPSHFDPVNWSKRLGLPGAVSLQVQVLDGRGQVVAATAPDLLGADRSVQDYYKSQRDSRRAGPFVSPAIRWKATGRWRIDLSRRLERDDGTFAGALVVTYDPWDMTDLLEQVDLGPRGLLALVGADGAIRTLVSPSDVPPGQDVAGSAMFRAAGDQGVWTGPSAPDRIERVHAFRRLRDQDLTIVVGVDRAVALRDSVAWSATALEFATGISLLIVLLAWLLLREIDAGRRREDRLSRGSAALIAAYRVAEAARASVDAKNAQLEGTLSGMSDGVMLLDPELRLARWNDRFPAFTGVPAALLRVGMPMAKLLRIQAAAGEFGVVEVDAEVARRMARLRTAGDITEERTRPDGRSVELRRSLLPGGGYVTLYTDVTARKRTEQATAEARRAAEAAAEQKSYFVAIVSHEIRTPLNAVVNGLALLDQSGLSAAQRLLATNARQAGDALLDLVNDILELSEVDSGRTPLRPVVFEPRDVMAGVADMFRAAAEVRNIELCVDVAAAVPQQLGADCGRLRQIVTNLVGNAVKFSGSGRVALHVAVTRLDGRPALRIGVADPGPRVADRDVGQLFQPFSRLGNARDAGTPGTGLGLAICERLTRLMGGQIGLGPAAGDGNEFWIVLPFDAATPSADAAVVDGSDRRARRSTVLLVEDVPANQLVTATILRRAGHRVDVAESGAEAIRLVGDHPYDLVLMDLLMPGMRGFEAAERIRRLPGLAADVPIVALTANTAADDRARCLAAGMNDLVGKPIRSAELLGIVGRMSWPATVPRVDPDAPPIDAGRLADLQRGLSPVMLASLMEQCLTDIRQRLPLLREAVGSGEVTAIEANAHALAGMAATYGLAGLDRRMRGVMAAARQGDMPAAVTAAQDLEIELTRATAGVRAALRAVAA